MKLGRLIQTTGLTLVRGDRSAEITGISLDSRQIRSGNLFVAVKGALTDGHVFIADAVQRGAVAVALTDSSIPVPEGVAVVQFKPSTTVMAEIADAYYGRPDCILIGITGTNGKTTSAYLIRYFLEAAGLKTGLISTVAYECGTRRIPASRTTPDVFQLYSLLHQMAGNGAQAVVMEVSSHALVQNRIGKLTYDITVFTNLTQDHLDYHHTMEEYYLAKRMLFDLLSVDAPQPRAIVTIDDQWGMRLAAELREQKVPLWTCSITRNDADMYADEIEVMPAGSRFVLHGLEQEARVIDFNLLGRHNVANCLVALAVEHAVGFPLESCIPHCTTIPQIPGRLEFVENNLDLVIVIDYAHTDDALRNVCMCLREITEKDIWLVFGCGGDRDSTKRPLMGAVAEAHADHIILTNDNPRTESPEQIIAHIRAGMRKGTEQVIMDRREAIKEVCRKATPGDIILIAGKGHETYQEINRVFIDYDERVITREIVAELESERV